MKRANGQGTIVKLTGNRRKPYAIRKVIGWKEDGRPKLQYISYHRTKREAERALKVYNDDPYIISNKTVSELYTEWYAARESQKADSTLKGYASTYAHLEPIYDLRVRDLNRNVIQRFYDDLDVNKYAFGLVVSLIGMLIDYAVKRELLPISALNINKSIMLPDKPTNKQKPRAVIDKADINRLWELKDENEYARVILVYIYTGLRFSELKNLHPEDCHDNYIEIKQAKTRAGVRNVPLSDKVLSLLPIISVPARSTFTPYFKELLPDHVIHDTRHTFISLMAEAGVDDRIIKAIVGHKPKSVTDIYTHISVDIMLKAVNLI